MYVCDTKESSGSAKNGHATPRYAVLCVLVEGKHCGVLLYKGVRLWDHTGQLSKH